MLGEIDLSLKPLNPQFHICKPNKVSVGKLKHILKPNLQVNLGKLNELTFEVPYDIDINHKLKRNPHIDNIRERYFIKLKIGNSTEYFIINEINEDSDDTSDKKSVHAFSLGYELNDKQIRNYKVESYNLTQVGTEALSKTIWSIGYVDSEFDLKYRSFDVSEKTVLDFIFEIAETFNAIIQWDTENRLIDFVKEENIGTYKGLHVSYGKLLKSLSKESKADEMVTRLNVYGNEGLSIQRINPTGSTYLENFSYFLFPFQRDENKNTIQSSDYMSDSLCHAILDYEELVESKKGEFDTLLTDKENLQATLTTKENELFDLETNLAIINDKLDVQKATGTFTAYNFIYNGTTTTKTTELDNTEKYAVIAKVSTTTNVTVKLDGVTKTLSADTWTVLGKLSNTTSTSVEISGSATNVEVNIYIVDITDEEYSTAGNESTIIDTYNDQYKQSQIDAKQAEIDQVNNDIALVDADIQTLRDTLAVENNFTQAQLEERSQYIVERTWSDENYIDDQDLYDDAIKRFEEMKKPKTSFNVNIVNFLEIIEEQRNWDKLNIGDEIRIKYEKFNADIKAKIISIDYDFENQSINLEIANVTEIDSEENKLIKMLYSSYSTSTSVDMNKFKWDKAEDDIEGINQIITEKWDATKREIVAGVNESVSISRRGIIIKDSNDPLRYLVAQNSVLAITNDGGQTWKHAISADGIVGERIFGKIIAGVNLSIENESGLYTIDKDGFTIDSGALTIIGGTNGISLDPNDGLTITRNDDKVKTILNATDGFKIQKYNTGTSSWEDKLYADTDGKLIAEELTTKKLIIDDGSGNILINADTKTIDFDGFTVKNGTIEFDNVYGGTATLGGTDNTNGRLLVLDANGETVVDLDASNMGIDKLYVGDLNSPSIINASSGNITFYVDPVNGDDANDGSSWSSPFKTFQKAIDSLPKYLNHDVKIWGHIDNSSDVTENLNISGFVGSGIIDIDLQTRSNTLNGVIQVEGCSGVRVYIQSLTVNHANSTQATIFALRCTDFYLKDAVVYTRNSHNYSAYIYSSYARLENCEFYDAGDSVIIGAYGAQVDIMDCKGLAPYGVKAWTSSIIGGYGTAPAGSTANISETYGGYIGATWTHDSGAATPPPAPETTKTWTATSKDNWSSDGYWSGDHLKQGNWGYGRRTGYAWFGSTPSDTVTGKTISKIRVYIKRASNGGYSSATGIVIRSHSLTSKPASASNMYAMSSESKTVNLAWGEDAWVTLPSSMFTKWENGTWKGVGIYIASDSGSDYAVLSGDVKLEITYS